MDAQAGDAAGEALIGGGDHAGVAEAAEVLRRVEAERGGIAQTARAASVIPGTDGLRGIFQHEQPASLGDGVDRPHVGGLAVQMDRDDRPRLRRDGAFESCRVEVQGFGLDVDEDGRGAGAPDGAGGREERVRRGDDLVARPDSQGHQGQEQGVGARGAPDGEGGLAVAGGLRLELRDLGAEDEVLALDDAPDRAIDLVADAQVLRLEVEGRYGDRIGGGAHRRTLLCRLGAAGGRIDAGRAGLRPEAGRTPQPSFSARSCQWRPSARPASPAARIFHSRGGGDTVGA